MCIRDRLGAGVFGLWRWLQSSVLQPHEAALALGCLAAAAAGLEMCIRDSVHSMHWALAYGQGAGRVAKALKGGVTMATTRFRYGDNFTVENYKEIEGLAPNPAGARFADAIQALRSEKVCWVPVAQVEQANATTIGLGDAFVGGFLPALLP